MYIVNVTIRIHEIEKERLAGLLERHSAWFTGHFQQGDFLLLGPYLDWEGSGIILAQAENRAALEKILSGDAFYAEHLAEYQVHEFKAAKIAAQLKDYQDR